jgi:hypothetical protein
VGRFPSFSIRFIVTEKRVAVVAMDKLTPETFSQFLAYPTEVPPPGVTPNFINPYSTAYQIYITAGVCIVLILGFSLIRFLSNTRHSPKPTIIRDESQSLLCVIFPYGADKEASKLSFLWGW